MTNLSQNRTRLNKISLCTQLVKTSETDPRPLNSLWRNKRKQSQQLLLISRDSMIDLQRLTRQQSFLKLKHKSLLLRLPRLQLNKNTRMPRKLSMVLPRKVWPLKLPDKTLKPLTKRNKTSKLPRPMLNGIRERWPISKKDSKISLLSKEEWKVKVYFQYACQTCTLMKRTSHNQWPEPQPWTEWPVWTDSTAKEPDSKE